MKFVHGTEKRFGCEECPKRFERKSGLDRHGVHMGTRNFPCSTCNRKLFKDKGSLVAHIRNVHKHNIEAINSIRIIQPNMKKEDDMKEDIPSGQSGDSTISKLHSIFLPCHISKCYLLRNYYNVIKIYEGGGWVAFHH